MFEIIAAGITGVVVGAVAMNLSRRRASTLPATTVESSERDFRRLNAILDSMAEGMALLDEKGTVLSCNPAFETMFRLSVGKAIQNSKQSEQARASLLRSMEDVVESGKVATFEITLATAPPRNVLVTLSPWQDDEISNAVILVAFDVTNLRQAEEVRANFVANVSHELRTPLAAIRGYSETCLDSMEAGEDPPFQRFMPIIHHHTERLNALIEDLLTLSRIESASNEITLEKMQLAELVAAAFTTLAPRADAKSLALINELPAALPDVLADHDSLERVLLNLLENAIKYSESETEVRICARVQATELVVMVKDQGVGIPPEHQARIFERFYRVDKARSRKEGGTGLGLSIVKHLVQRMSGTVWVDSEPDGGSTFFFTLPLAR